MEALYSEYWSLLMYVAAKKFHVPEADCEPLVHDALFAYLTSGCRIDDPRAWLVGAACNASRHYWRDRVRLSDMEGTRLDDLPDLPQHTDVERLDRAIFVRRLLDGLRPGEREILRLHYFEGLSAREIAAMRETTVRYAEKLIWKALAHLRCEDKRLRGALRATVVATRAELMRGAKDIRAQGISDLELGAQTHSAEGVTERRLSLPPAKKTK